MSAVPQKRKNEDTKPKNDDLEAAYLASRHRASPLNVVYNLPLWLFILVIGWVAIIYAISTNETWSNIFSQMVEGVPITLQVAVTAYLLALFIGLILGLIRSSLPRPGRGLLGGILSFFHMLLYNLATFYVEIMRGLPILIVLVIGAFIIFPEIRNALFVPIFGEAWVRENMGAGSIIPAVVGLGMAYGAFTSETIRAGIQSIEKGQMEAARSLGMNYFQAMRFIILPQAIRRVLPALGNDVIAMIKDSSLVSVLGVRDISQIARVSSGRSFRYLETYLIVAFIYLTLTIVGSFLVKLMERSLKQGGAKPNVIMIWINRFGRGPGGMR
jgi:polar amino acid transport system permease protein